MVFDVSDFACVSLELKRIITRFTFSANHISSCEQPMALSIKRGFKKR